MTFKKQKKRISENEAYNSVEISTVLVFNSLLLSNSKTTERCKRLMLNKRMHINSSLVKVIDSVQLLVFVFIPFVRFKVLSKFYFFSLKPC